jgi:hypothetical protein
MAVLTVKTFVVKLDTNCELTVINQQDRLVVLDCLLTARQLHFATLVNISQVGFALPAVWHCRFGQIWAYAWKVSHSLWIMQTGFAMLVCLPPVSQIVYGLFRQILVQLFTNSADPGLKSRFHF